MVVNTMGKQILLSFEQDNDQKGISFKSLLKRDNNWQKYKEKCKDILREVEVDEVEKLLGCGDFKNGFATFICLNDGHTKRIPFSCKSRLCSRCGKKYTDEWTERIDKDMFSVIHRHIVLTISDKLWGYFEKNSELLKLLMDTAGKTVKRMLWEFSRSGKSLIPGVIMVLHPYGSDLKTNPHVHMLVTEGGLTKDNHWHNQPFIPYNILRRIWQYEILTALRKRMPYDTKLNQIIDWCFTRRKNGFIIYAKDRIRGNKRGAIGYIGRYIRHPVISNKRIISYDGAYVVFQYEDRDKQIQQKKMPVLEFIRDVLKHLPDKQFKMVRYYGLYSRRIRAKVYRIMKALKLFIKRTICHTSWRYSKKQYTGVDPLACPVCGEIMELYSITYPYKGEMKTVGGIDWLIRRLCLLSVDKGEKDEKIQKEEKEQDLKDLPLFKWTKRGVRGQVYLPGM